MRKISHGKMIAAQNRLERMETNNVFHLLMSIITIGTWIPIWVLVAINNALERKRLIKLIEKCANQENKKMVSR